ncbi:Amino acids transporter [Operophtera brumata]|uniref:Amino acids transporter n=1 Tax=Operophtera brumata TaxID=104452 RepID=A0A0L7L6L1_OPEBR|nr:Amino acids transporter [Operophtera brumata]
MPVVFVGVSCVLLVVPVVSEPTAVLAGALMTLAGVPVYLALVRSRPAAVERLSTKFTHTCQKMFLSAVEDKEE